MVVPSPADKPQYLTWLRDNADLLAAAARRDLSRTVPGCPGWDVAFLVFHTGVVQRNWTTQVRDLGTTPLETLPHSMFDGYPAVRSWGEPFLLNETSATPPPSDLVDWFEEGAAQLISALDAADPEKPVWSWSNDHRAWHHHRMMVFETTIHRWDAQQANNCLTPIDRELALHGIEQTFDTMLPARRQWNSPPPGEGESFHFHCTDGEGEWSVTFVGNRATVTREHMKADVAVRGTAENLFLFLWQRLPAERLDVVGNVDGLARWWLLVPPG